MRQFYPWNFAVSKKLCLTGEANDGSACFDAGRNTAPQMDEEEPCTGSETEGTFLRFCVEQRGNKGDFPSSFK